MASRAAKIASQTAPNGGPPATFVTKGEAAIFAMDVPPLNTLGAKNRRDILGAIAAYEANPALKVMVITGKGNAFCAGADITEFGSLGAKLKKAGGKVAFADAPLEDHLPKILDMIEQCKKPIVAAVNGMALGGGCEVALACHYRIASPKAVFGLPEIKLGVIPGAGGTQRLPRLIGVENAIAMCCGAINVKAPKAAKWGVCDKIAQGNLIEEAIAFGMKINPKQIRRLCNDTSKLPNFIMTRIIFNQARKQLSAKVPKGLPSPLAALEAIEAACKASNFQQGMQAEAMIFARCITHPSAQAMQHFFFSERMATRVPGLPKATSKPQRPRSVGVIGGGTMGGGIAMCFMNVGVKVVLMETAADRKKFAIDNIAKNYQVRVKKGKMTEEKFNQKMSLLNVVVNDYSALQDVDYVIEAVFENMNLKKEIFAKLDKVCKPSCVLASNTSTLSIDEIASATSRPNKVIGAHFFSPADVMMLLEFVRGKDTDAETINQSMFVGKLIRKKPVLAGNCFGFISNRMILRAGFQSQCMVEDGAQPFEVDKVIGKKGFGFPMGPFEMNDLAGVDVGVRIKGETPVNFRPKRDATTLMERLVKANRFGQKTNKGFYLYDPKNPRKAIRDPAVERMALAISKEKGIKRRYITNKEIEERYIYILINEAAYLLQEGFAIRPSDIDIVFIYGFGFPPYKGGPCWYADHLGLEKVVEGIKKYNTALGPDNFPGPCPLLTEMVASGRNFASLNKEKMC